MAQFNDDRQWYTGDWKCAQCNKAIDRLPFQPDENRLDTLKCRDCHQKSRNQFGGGGGGGAHRFGR